MKNIYDKVQEGVLSLSSVPTETLLEWLKGASTRDADLIGCEVMYRR